MSLLLSIEGIQKPVCTIGENFYIKVNYILPIWNLMDKVEFPLSSVSAIVYHYR